MLLSQVSDLKNELTKRASTPKALLEELGSNVTSKLSELKATVTNIKDGAPVSDKGLWRLDSDGMPLPEDGSVVDSFEQDSPSQGNLLYRLRSLEAKVATQATEILECKKELEDRDRRIAQLQSRCGTLTAKLEERESQVVDLEGRLARLGRRIRESEIFGPPPWAAGGGGVPTAGAEAAAVNWLDPGEAFEEELVPGYDELCALLREPVAAPLLGMIDSFVKALLLKNARPSDHSMVHNFLGAMENPFRSHKLWRDAAEDEMLLTLDALETYILRDPRILQSVLSHMPLGMQERDERLAQRMWCLQFVRAEHLDVSKECATHPAAILARRMLVRMTQVPSPQEKIECIFRAARMVYRMLNELAARQGRAGASADDFLPAWILVVLRAQPPRLLSTLEYVCTFRSPGRLCGERHYYLVQLQTATAFLEHLDAPALTIHPDEFHRLMAQREADWRARTASSSDNGSRTEDAGGFALSDLGAVAL